MKRIFVIFLCLMLLLAGCAQQSAPTEATVPETTVPVTEAPTEPTETEPPVPETVTGTALVDKTYVILLTVERDSTVEIVGEFEEDFYVVKLETGYGLIEKRLVRMEGAEGYEQWQGYARQNAAFYENYHLTDEEPETLNMNSEVTVLDSLGDCLVVQQGEQIGYMLEKEVSRYYIKPSYGGGGGGTGADGGDITLSLRGGIVKLSTFVPQSGEVTGKAAVLANGAEILLGWFDSEDAIRIVTEDGFAEPKEGCYTVYLEGVCGYVRQALVLKEGETAYEQWDGYARSNAALYANYYLTGEPASKLQVNAKLKILQDLGNCYLVSVNDSLGYMAKETVSKNYINYNYGGGGGGGDWSPPAM